MLHDKVKHLSDVDWHRMMMQSVESREVDGVELPGFPPVEAQRILVGTSGRNAIAEAFGFYNQVKRWSRAVGNPVGPTSTMLDFGVGWGRMIRFFAKDIPDDRLFGVDVNEYAVSECRRAGVEASVSLIDKRGRLPFEDGTFTHIIAYSVFTHLAPEAASHWMAELSRVAAEGAVFVYTVEPREFLEGAATGVTGSRPIRILPEQWREPAKQALRHVDSLGYAFLPTVGEHHANDYGDAVYLPDYIKTEWGRHFTLVDYVSDPQQIAQAGVVMRKEKVAEAPPLKVACFMMQKNEHMLLEHWWRYHAALFGVENLYVFDNGSSHPTSLKQLSEAKAAGVNIDRSYTKKEDFETKGNVLGSLARKLAPKYDFLMFQDCDEFIAVTRPDASISCAPEDIISHLKELRGSSDILRVKGSYNNVPGETSSFFFYDAEVGKKLFFASAAFDSIDMGFHKGKAKTSDIESPTRLIHFHFQNKPLSELLAAAREKLVHRVPSFDLETLRKYRGNGAHLAQYFFLTEETYKARYNSSAKVRITEFADRLKELGMPVPYQTSPRRHMPVRLSDEEAILLTAFLECADHYVEFGSGGTTCLAARTVAQSVISVDSSKEWIASVQAACAGQDGLKPTMRYADIGPIKEWGYPVDESAKSRWPNYHNDIWQTRGAEHADLFFVDGRFRVACFLQILLRCKPETTIAFHDYATREHYHIVERVATKVAQVGDLAIFRPILMQRPASIEDLLVQYAYDPA